MSDFLQLPPFPTQPPSTIPLTPPNVQPDQGTDSVFVLPELDAPATPVIVQQGPYHLYAVAKTIIKESGLALQAVGGPDGTPADVIRHSAPSGMAIVRWVSRRLGQPPILPSEDLGCANEVFLRSQVTFCVPGHFASGSQVWQANGVYVYGLRVPYKETDTITVGRMPYTDEVAADNQITPDLYDKGILGPDTPPAGAPTDPITF